MLRRSHLLSLALLVSCLVAAPLHAAQAQVCAERLLLHDHAGEQPFTRDLYGVRVPRGVRHVVIQARGQQQGWGGKTLEVALPGR